MTGKYGMNELVEELLVPQWALATGEVEGFGETSAAHTVEEGEEDFAGCEGGRDSVVVCEGEGGVVRGGMAAKGVEDFVGEGGDEGGGGEVVEGSLLWV